MSVNFCKTNKPLKKAELSKNINDLWRPLPNPPLYHSAATCCCLSPLRPAPIMRVLHQSDAILENQKG